MRIKGMSLGLPLKNRRLKKNNFSEILQKCRKPSTDLYFVDRTGQEKTTKRADQEAVQAPGVAEKPQ